MGPGSRLSPVPLQARPPSQFRTAAGTGASRRPRSRVHRQQREFASLFLAFVHRQPDGERSPASRLGFKRDGAAVALYHHRVHNCQSLARAFAYRFSGKEGIEYVLLDGDRNAAPRIAYANLREAPIAAGADLDGAAGARFLHHIGNRMGGVDNEIQDHLVELSGDSGHRRQVRIQVGGEVGDVLPFISRDQGHIFDRAVDVNRHFDYRAGMRKLAHRTNDPGDLLDSFPQLANGLREGVEQVARIVRAMREFSHPGPVIKMPVDINRAIENMALVSRNEWKYVADLTTDLDPDLPPVPGIAGEFNQVILNLIVNAAHAIADVVKESGARGSIQIRTRCDGRFAEIRVSDTGCGIPVAIQQNIFDPFFTTKPVGKGTGQGLAIVHSVVVQRHRGAIALESEPGRGTTFTIRLPVDESEEQ